MFSEAEKKAIDEKLGQLSMLKTRVLSPEALKEIITIRRVNWMKDNLEEMLAKYKGLKPEVQAYNIVFFDHMKINKEHSKMKRLSPTKIRIESHNFCPYLQACKKLELDTRYICKEIGEPAIQKMIKIINPKLVFSRDYENIRPYNGSYCEEFIELVS